MLPIRGRYVTLNLVLETDPDAPPPEEAERWSVERAILSVKDGALHASVPDMEERIYAESEGADRGACLHLLLPRGR